MPFKSQAQRRKFYAMASRGEISKSTVKEWEEATPKGKKLPEKVKKSSAMPRELKWGLMGLGAGGLLGGALGASRPVDYETGRAIKNPSASDRVGQGFRAGLGFMPVGFMVGRAAGAFKDFKDTYKTYQHYQGGAPGYRSRGPVEVPSWLKGVKTKADAKAAFRSQAMRHHPDRGGSLEKMKEVNVAWEAFARSPHFEKLSAAFFDELRKMASVRNIVLSRML